MDQKECRFLPPALVMAGRQRGKLKFVSFSQRRIVMVVVKPFFNIYSILGGKLLTKDLY